MVAASGFTPMVKLIFCYSNKLFCMLYVSLQCFVSTGQNHYRKPSTAVWDHFEEKCNGGVKLDTSKCVYVGDAAGRPKDWAPGKGKDFSCSDRMFAANIGIGK